MLIENYKGVDIRHDASRDEFVTNIIINKRSGKNDEKIRAPRLQKIRDDIDKWINTATKKPIVKKIWVKDHNGYKKVAVIVYNLISKEVIVDLDGRNKTIAINGNYRDEKMYIACKENDAIISTLMKKDEEKRKIERETSCSSGKLIPLTTEHFK